MLVGDSVLLPNLKKADMTHQCICDWLGLTGETWPPDHYRLLGLAPGEGDAAHIEQQVHERLEKVRRYQLLYPDVVTEAMNRLAQAFVCLTDAEAKKAYDAKLFQPTLAPVHEEGIEETPSSDSRDPLAWLYQRQDFTRAVTQLDVPAVGDRSSDNRRSEPDEDDSADTAGEETNADDVPAFTPPPIRRPLGTIAGKKDVILEAAHTSLPARRGLGTKRALYHRIARTRQLLRAWNEAGEYVGHPGRKLAKPIEATDLIHALITLRTHLKSFPPLLGQAGQPGYLVVALARQQVIVPTFQTLLPSQRDSLARDWRAGLKLLHAHLDFLRQELRAMRRRGLVSRTFRIVNGLFHSHLGLLILALGFLAVVVAAWRSVPPEAAEEPKRPGVDAAAQEVSGAYARSMGGPNSPKRDQQPDGPNVLPKRDALGPSKETLPPKESVVPPPASEERSLQVKERYVQAEDIHCIRVAAFVNTGHIVACNGEHRLLLWDLASAKVEEISSFPSHVASLAVCPRTGQVACGDGAGGIHIGEVKADIHWEVDALEQEHTKEITSLAFSADGKWLLSSGLDKKLVLWDVKARKLEQTLDELPQPACAVVLSSDGSRAIAGDADGVIHVWDLKSNRKGNVPAHEKSVTSLALTNDGQTLFSAGKDGVINHWNLANPIKGSKRGEIRDTKALALDPDGSHLYSGGLDKKIRQWSTDGSSEPRILDGAHDLIYSLAVSSDGKWLLSGEAGGKLVLTPIPQSASPAPK
jgi:hypothetical protein